MSMQFAKSYFEMSTVEKKSNCKSEGAIRKY